MPAIVAARTMGDRRIGGLPQKVNDSKWMWRSGTPARPSSAASPHESVGTAQVDIAVAHVGDDLAEGVGVEAHLVARSDDVDEAATAPPELGGDLVAQDEVPVREPRSRTVTSASSGSSCRSERIGAVPTPAPTSSTRSRSRGLREHAAAHPGDGAEVGRRRAAQLVGVFFMTEGLGVAWPAGDAAVLYLVAFLVALSQVQRAGSAMTSCAR